MPSELMINKMNKIKNYTSLFCRWILVPHNILNTFHMNP